MDERIEHGDDSSTVARSAFGRREMLQRTGFVVGAAALWATPVVQTIGMRPAAASIVILDACPEQRDSGQPSDLTWRVTPRNASDQFNTPSNPGDWDDPDNAAVISGDLGCLGPDWVVDVEVFVNSKNIGGSPLSYPGLDSTNATFTVPGKPGAWTSFRITVVSGGEEGCAEGTVQTIEEIHTSCSQPLEVGFWWGSIDLVTVGATS